MASRDSQSAQTCRQMVYSLQRVARQAESCIRYRAILSCLAAMLAVLAILMLVDCVFRREEAGLRWLAWLCLLGSTGYAAFRWVVPIRHLKIEPLDVARWIESQQPQWSGRLMTALELSQVEANDVRYGSQAFRMAALENLQPCDTISNWERTVDWSKFRRVAAICLGICGLIALAMLVRPDFGLYSLGRILAPWADRPWPRQDQLHFVDLPAAVGRDRVLQVEIADANPPLPDNVVVLLKQANSDLEPQSIQAQIVGEVAVANLPPITEDIQIRALGGDDQQMPWRTIRAVATPTWKRFHFEIQPPEYLREIPLAMNRLSKTIDASRGSYELIGQRIQVVVGSGVRFEGEFDSPVSNVELRASQSNSSETNVARKGSQTVSQTSSAGRTTSPWKVEFSHNRVTLEGEKVDSFAALNHSFAWSFRVQLPGEVELDCPEKWQIEVIPDKPPEIVLNQFLLKSLALGSDLHFGGQTRDDWGLRRLTAKVVINEESASEIELPLQVEPQYSKQIAFRQSWNVSSALAAKGYNLKAQDQVAFWVEAIDVRDQFARSATERFTVEPPQRQLENISSRQSGIARQIGELLRLQHSARQLASRNAESIQQYSASQGVQQQHLDAATSVSQMQNTIRQQLADSSQSVLASIDAQLELIQQSNLADSPLASQLALLREEIAKLSKEAAFDAHQQAVELQSAIEKALSAKQELKAGELAQRLDSSQLKSEQTLTRMLEGLDQVEAGNRQLEKLLQIAQQQEAIMLKTNQLGIVVLQNQGELQAQLDPLAAHQNQLATELEQWLRQNLKPATDSQTNQPQLAGVAQYLLEQNAIDGMRNSSGSLRSKQIGDALQTQKMVQQILEQAIGKLAPTGNHGLLDDLAQQEQRLRELAGQLQQLAGRQNLLAQQFSESQAQTDTQPLTDQQKQLIETAKKLQQQVINMQEAKQLLQNAIEKQAQAASSASAGQMNQAAEQAREAANDLSKLTEQIQHQVQQAQEQVQMQQMFELVAQIEQLASKQKELMPQYTQLGNQLQLPTLPADFAQLRQALILRQTAVRDQLRQALPQIAQMQVFHWVLEQADQDLTRAIAEAERDRVRPAAIESAQAGLRKMELAIESVAKSESNSAAPENQQSEQEKASNRNQQSETLPPIVSLKLIRALQLELKQQTELLDNTPADERSRRLSELTRQQRALADLFEAFINDLQSQQQQQ